MIRIKGVKDIGTLINGTESGRISCDEIKGNGTLIYAAESDRISIGGVL
jgi:hypothetical protein